MAPKTVMVYSKDMVKKPTPRKKVRKSTDTVSKWSHAKARWNSFGSGRKVFSLLLLAVAAYFLVYIGQIIVQKIQFDAEKRAIHAVYEQIITEIGPPAKSEIYSKCTYQNLKYSRGDRRCGTSLKIEYPVLNDKEASRTMGSAHKIIVQYPDFKLSYITSPDLEFNELTEQSHVSKIESSISYKNTPGRCGSEYVYMGDKAEKVIENQSVSLFLGCYGDAKFEFFPVREQ